MIDPQGPFRHGIINSLNGKPDFVVLALYYSDVTAEYSTSVVSIVSIEVYHINSAHDTT